MDRVGRASAFAYMHSPATLPGAKSRGKLMALASQSTRSDRPVLSSRRSQSSLASRGLVVGVAAAAALGGAFWLMRNQASESGEAPAPALSVQGVPSASDASLARLDPTVTATPIAPASARSSALELAMSDAANSARAEIHRENAERALLAETPAAAQNGQTQPATQPAGTTPPASPQPAPAAPQAPVGNGFDGTPTNAPSAGGGAPRHSDSVADALALAATNPIEARAALSQAILSGTLGPIEAKQVSDVLAKLGTELFFTPNFNANDKLFFQYTVQSGDSLERIVRKHKLGCDWRLVARINNIKKPEAIRVGQRLKLPKGPFSAVVSKRDYRVDLCIGAGSERVVFMSLPCGLGKSNGTPVGRFKVRAGSKLLNPEWRNPITGEFFNANDPANPIGEHWLGLEGIEPSNSALLGYGMHGTIEPNSIGQDQSLGCVRLLADDIAIVWETLGDGCEVEIR